MAADDSSAAGIPAAGAPGPGPAAGARAVAASVAVAPTAVAPTTVTLAPAGGAAAGGASGAIALAGLPRRGWRRWSPDTWVWLLSFAMAATAVILGLTTVATGPVNPRLDLPLWILLAAFLAAEVFVVHLPFGRNTYSFSMSEVPVTLSLVSVAPIAGVLLRLIGSGSGLLVGRVRGVKLGFNLASVALETCVAAIVFRAILGDGSFLYPRGWLAAITAAVAVGALGATLIATAICLHEQSLAPRMFLEALITAVIAAVTNTAVAIITVIVLNQDLRAGLAIVLVAAIVLSAHRSWTSLSRRHAHLQVLCDFTKTVSDNPDGESVARSVLAEARRVLRGDISELVVTGGAVTPGARFRLDRSAVLHAIADTDGPAWWQIVPDDHGRRFPRRARDAEVRSVLACLGLADAVVAPLRSSRGVIGSILVGNRLDDVSTFDDDDVRLLETLAGHAGVEIENGNLLDRLRSEAAEKEHQALHDQLTGLPNRRCFVGAVAAALAEGSDTAVMLMDLDRFKEINDTLGHAAGDKVLTAVAARIAAVLGDDVLTARFGGDEFAVLLPATSRADIEGAGMALLVALEEPVSIDGLAVDVGASIGVAIAPLHGDEADLLIQRADVAMYVAKEQQTGLEIYSAERDSNDVRRLAMVAELRQDITEGRLGVEYQVKVDVATGGVLGAEALARWHSERYGSVPPEEFVPIAECTGLIGPLAQHVLRDALGQLAGWRAAGQDVTMAVNISVRSLLDPGLPDLVALELARAQVDPGALTIEITESHMMRDPDRILSVLTRLSDLGVRLSIDDFGTGYSSLGYLNRLPVQEVKIDRSFVAGMANDSSDRAIVQAIIRLGHELGLQVVAEGVEDEATWALLARAGCDVAQGFLFARPLPAADATAVLQRPVPVVA